MEYASIEKSLIKAGTKIIYIYKIHAKEHQAVDSWAADEILAWEIFLWKYVEYVPLILRNYKILMRTKIVRFTISSCLSA